jgi:hypothetical protein
VYSCTAAGCEWLQAHDIDSTVSGQHVQQQRTRKHIIPQVQRTDSFSPPSAASALLMSAAALAATTQLSTSTTTRLELLLLHGRCSVPRILHAGIEQATPI